jgi:ribosomal protein S15P/S13E
MKVKINLHEALVSALGSNTVRVPAAIDIDDLLEYGDASDYEIDIHDLLAEQQAIALIWDADQLLSHYPHLTKDQAWAVLQECERNYKGVEGLCWDGIDDLINERYPDAREAKERLLDQLHSLRRQLEALPTDEQVDPTEYGELTAKLVDIEEHIRQNGGAA